MRAKKVLHGAKLKLKGANPNDTLHPLSLLANFALDGNPAHVGKVFGAFSVAWRIRGCQMTDTTFYQLIILKGDNSLSTIIREPNHTAAIACCVDLMLCSPTITRIAMLKAGKEIAIFTREGANKIAIIAEIG